jgi:XTP/dITP diphosphohydrolase
MQKLLLASNNSGKLIEIKNLLRDLPIDLVTPSDLNILLQINEDGSTYKENAEKKSVQYARKSGLVSLADDTGLEVDVLGGKPGIHSARITKEKEATDADRRNQLLDLLKIYPQPWNAKFRCVVAIATPSDKIYFFEGLCQGEIIPDEQGEHGFGYDPIFFLPELNKTMAQLSLTEKNEISHRAKAIRAAKSTVLDLVKGY